MSIMNMELADFITDLFKTAGIPSKKITYPCEDWSWLDQGLRTTVLGIVPSDWNQRMNQRILTFKEATIYHFSDI